jgi:hypothetical protein
MSDLTQDTLTHETIIAQTQHWLETMVIGLNLCPFARKPFKAGLIRYVVSDAQTERKLFQTLIEELQWLHRTPASEVETTLLIHPDVLHDFYVYNDFLGMTDDAIEQLGLTGELQIASFHPRYQFAGTASDDVTNYTNRSPYPMLHILRESSISQVADVADVELIPERNMATLQQLGLVQVQSLQSK